VNIQKAQGNISGKTTPENTTQNAAQTMKSAAGAVSKNALLKAPQMSAQSATKSATQSAPRSVSSLISAAGLPADKLSASVISFARFFSLPLKPELLKNIRQQAFAQTSDAVPSATLAAEDGVPERETVLNKRESLALAAAAAESKGVELQPKGLEAYARAVDPEWRRDGEQGDQRGRRKKDGNEKEAAPLQKSAAVSAAVNDVANDVVSAESLEKYALEETEKNPLLAILNSLPEKDGKRWIALPFDFSDNGREFKVSLRILLDTGKTVNRADCMALDIAIRDIEGNGNTGKRQLFVLEPANRLSVYLQPEITQAKQAELVRGLSALLEIAPERIFVKTLKESFPFETGGGDGFLRSIDEAV